MATQQASPNPPQAGPYGFPTRWALFVRSPRTFKICAEKEAPCYAIGWHQGNFGRPWLDLRAGPHRKKAPILVDIKRPFWGFKNRHGFNIRMYDPADKKKEPEIIEVKAGFGVMSRPYQFTMDLANGRRETFEWRHSHCEEVRMLNDKEEEDAKKGGILRSLRDGWKLVRLDGQRGVPDTLGYTDQGEEVVAVWGRAGMSFHKKIYFQYWNSGSTGELGERFTQIASLSAVGLYYNEEKERAEREARARARRESRNNNM